MSQEFLEVLARIAPSAEPERRNVTAHELETLVLQLAASLHGLGEPRVLQDILACFSARALAFLGGGETAAQPTKYPPELLSWARTHVNLDAAAADLREVKATGGLVLDDFIHELEQGIPPRE